MKVDAAIRKMARDDVGACVEIAADTGLSAWSTEGFIAELNRPNALAFVAESDRRVIGFAIGRMIEADRSAEIYNIGVQTDLHNKGIGSALFRAFESESRKHIIDSIWLEVRSSNFNAIRFYERHGFREMSTRRGFYSNPADDALVMQKKL
jgi:ribosomal-protein-alanine N-acetyltransferase